MSDFPGHIGSWPMHAMHMLKTIQASSVYIDFIRFRCINLILIGHAIIQQIVYCYKLIVLCITGRYSFHTCSMVPKNKSMLVNISITPLGFINLKGSHFSYCITINYTCATILIKLSSNAV